MEPLPSFFPESAMLLKQMPENNVVPKPDIAERWLEGPVGRTVMPSCIPCCVIETKIIVYHLSSVPRQQDVCVLLDKVNATTSCRTTTTQNGEEEAFRLSSLDIFPLKRDVTMTSSLDSPATTGFKMTVLSNKTKTNECE